MEAKIISDILNDFMTKRKQEGLTELDYSFAPFTIGIEETNADSLKRMQYTTQDFINEALKIKRIKDRHEIAGITTQITFNGADGILLSQAVPSRTSFAQPKHSDLSVVLLSNEASVDNDLWKNYVVNSYSINGIDISYTLKTISYTVVGLPKDLPAHKAWAIVDSDNELRLLSNTKLPVDAQGNFVLYYGIEKIII